ncbi:MAG: sulfurtransferase [Chloroflexi bacterium]|nr:sulfurtransferase [Chloroflexota bacterium]
MPDHTPLIQLHELTAHLGDPAWAIVDCRTDLTNPGWGRGAYLQSHIPGALHADLETDLSAPRTGLNGRHPLPSPEDLASVFSRWGIDDAVEVIAYDAGADFFAARLWWSLCYLGHTRAHVLDGGFAAWQAEGLPVSAGEDRRPARRFLPRPQRLIDARAPERYRGEVEPLDRVAGHIPRARSYEWRRSLAPDGRLLPARALRAQLEGALAGVAPDQTVVYCGSGVSASHVLLAMAVAGLHGARLYPGSWSEWCADPARPVAIGDQT